MLYDVRHTFYKKNGLRRFLNYYLLPAKTTLLSIQFLS